ncbi:MAG: hypothetical protein ACRCXL_11650 [Dermatophilaceae bacterium]
MLRSFVDGYRDGAAQARERREAGQDMYSRVVRGAKVVGKVGGKVGASRVAGKVRARLGIPNPPTTSPEGTPPPAGDGTPTPPTSPEGTPLSAGDGSPTPTPTPAPPASPEGEKTPAGLPLRGPLALAPQSSPKGEPVPSPTGDGSSTPSTPPGKGQTKESPMSTSVEVSELESLDAVIAEVKTATLMAEALTETLTGSRGWTTNLPDRWSSTDWGTEGINEVIATSPEVAQSLGDAEPLTEFLTKLTAELEKARALGEVAAEVGASGDVGRFTAA